MMLKNMDMLLTRCEAVTDELNDSKRKIDALEQEIKHQNIKLSLFSKELNKHKQEYNYLYQFNSNIFITLDETYIIKDFNFKAAFFLGYEPALLRNKLFIHFVSEDSLPTLKRALKHLEEKKTKQICELTLISCHGKQQYVQLEAVKKNELLHITITNITEIRQLQTQNFDLKKSYDLIRNLFQYTKDAIAALDSEFIFITLNQSFIELFSKMFQTRIKEGMCLQKAIQSIVPLGGQIIDICKLALKGEKQTLLLENKSEHMDIYYCHELTFNPIYNPEIKKNELIFYIKDLSNFKLNELHSRIQQAYVERESRSEVMGELVSTLAHEINQPLAAIQTFSHSCLLMLLKEKKQSPFAYPLEQIAQQTEHAGNIIHGMKNFLRDGALILEAININELIQDAISFLYYEGNFLSIELQLMPNPPPLLLDSVKIIQVILNLGRNSIEALQHYQQKKPKILIKTIVEEDHVVVHYQDNGPGIPLKMKDKVFHSNFSTKDRGTGLGLSICRSLIKAHGGNLFVNESTDGAWFVFTLPRQKANNDTE
jgi:two-component system sensor kinase FixL